MAERIAFPYLTPATRVYTAGVYPTKFFEAANGSTTAIRHGNRRSKSKLEATFVAITEDDAKQILDCYEDTMRNWDYIRFNKGDDGLDNQLGRGGMWEGVQNQDLVVNWYQENNVSASVTYWRFAEPPTVTSLYPGRVTVSCQFISYLDPH